LLAADCFFHIPRHFLYHERKREEHENKGRKKRKERGKGEGATESSAEEVGKGRWAHCTRVSAFVGRSTAGMCELGSSYGY
jgi:hypothetical protein